MFRFSQRVRQFMMGRYGNDSLNYALFVLYAIFGIINIFARRFVISLFMILLFALIMIRALSKNIYTRIRENNRFLKFWNLVKNFIKLQYDRIRERKTNVYRKCPGCKAVIRLPRLPGKHTVKCPKCSKRFEVKIK